MNSADTAPTTASVPTTLGHHAISPRATSWVLIAVLLSTCLGAMDQTVVAAALLCALLLPNIRLSDNTVRSDLDTLPTSNHDRPSR